MANLTKCHLGYILGNGKTRTLVDKIKSLVETLVPTTKKQVKSFLGLASYY